MFQQTHFYTKESHLSQNFAITGSTYIPPNSKLDPIDVEKKHGINEEIKTSRESQNAALRNSLQLSIC